MEVQNPPKRENFMEMPPRSLAAKGAIFRNEERFQTGRVILSAAMDPQRRG
jgi:hypothetical protein